MSKQMIISISREYGSGGHEVAKLLSERLGISFYDRNMLDDIASYMNVDADNLKKYDEKRKKLIISRTVRGHSNSPEEAIAEIQFDYLRKKAASGESFVVVGRCAEHILREYTCMIPIFILGDINEKSKRIQMVRNVTESEALSIMARHDKTRKAYHNSHCPNKWGDSRSYEISVNSSKLGVEKTVDLLIDFIKIRTENQSSI
ncbi:MAG: cytidylate kinase-like family protein [Oscillospiraceae bacterium]|nr:cytidylate kinase-like family protein [Oscillospiraceae bacterium]